METISIFNTKLLNKIQEEGETFGLKLNEKKCEHIQINSIGNVYFKNGKPVEETSEAKYLGCLLNDTVESKKELSRIISDTHVTWKKLEFWKNGNNELREKNIVYDAVIRTRLMYGIITTT